MAHQDQIEGASTGEQLIAACRGNNTDLLESLILRYEEPEDLANFLNKTTSVLGNHAYHEAASRGHYEIIDILLDQTDFECDPRNTLDHDTPLHSAIRFINTKCDIYEGSSNGIPENVLEASESLLSLMLDAGSDPTLCNRHNQTPIDLLSRRNTQVRNLMVKLIREWEKHNDEEKSEKRDAEFEERERIRELKAVEKEEAAALAEALARQAHLEDPAQEDAHVQPSTSPLRGSGPPPTAPPPPHSQHEVSVESSDEEFDMASFRRERERLRLQNGDV